MDELAQAIADLQEEKAVQLATVRLEQGMDATEVLANCQEGMVRVGKKFDDGDYFLSELVFSGSIFKRIAAMVEQKFEGEGRGEMPPSRGTVVIGTVQGDLHDLGKSIVVMLLQGAGYRVEDLGVNVPSERFVQALQETGAGVLGMSALLTTSFKSMRHVVEQVEQSGLRDRVKIMIGGGVVDESCLPFVKADAQSQNAFEAVAFCDQFLSITKNA